MAQRQYTMRARADATAGRRERIFAATSQLFLKASFEDITLQAIADGAGVSLKTVVRQFGTKEGLVLAASRWSASRETARRAVDPGDLEGAVAVLADRYERFGDLVIRRIALEDRFERLLDSANVARQSHLDWLATVFAEHLPRKNGPERSRRLLALFGATELYVWWSWRQRLGATRADATAAMREALASLLARWSKSEGGIP